MGFLEYKDDATLIPKNTSVILRRVPSSRPSSSLAPQPSQQAMQAISAKPQEFLPSGIPGGLFSASAGANPAAAAAAPTGDASKSEADRIREMVNQAGGSGWQPYVFILTNLTYFYFFSLSLACLFTRAINQKPKPSYGCALFLPAGGSFCRSRAWSPS